MERGGHLNGASEPGLRSARRSHSILPGASGQSRRLLGSQRRPTRFLLASVVVLGGPLLVTAIAPLVVRALPDNPLELAGLLYMLAVAGGALAGGVVGGVVAAGLSFVGQLYAYTPPMRAFDVVQASELLVLGVFLVVAIGFAQLISRQRTARSYEQVARERMAFLADASTVLSGSLDFHRTLTRLAELAIPRLADICWVEVLDADGMIRTIVVANSDRIDAALADNLLHQRPVRPGGPGSAGRVIQEACSVFHPRVHEHVLEEVGRDATHMVLLHGLGLGSLMIVPLVTPKGCIGAIGFGFTGGRRRYTGEDLTLTEDLARRAAAVLYTVLLYEERTRTSRMLQRALLPPEIPQIEGLEVSVRFHPVSDADLIGGDFYDVFEVRPGAWALIVGDVCGKGVEAATLTGLARHTVRAAALRNSSPSRILRTLNEAILRAGSERFCTAVLALIEPGQTGARITIANGGHPLPLLLRAASEAAQPIGRPGTLLGVFEDAWVEDATIELEPCDTFVLFTDGALDERLAYPEGRILDALQESHGRGAEACADAILRTRPEDGPPDDAAVVVVRVGCPAQRERVQGMMAWPST